MNVKVAGGVNLKGNVAVSGSKNAAIPIICASLLAKGKVLLRNVPRISDIFDLCKIIEKLDCKVVFKGHSMLIDNTNLKYKPLLFEECQRIRGSYYLIGVFLTIFSKCEIYLPGGCKIGSRPIDIHLQAFNDLGFEYTINNNILALHKTKALDFVELTMKNKSVGASINALFAGLGFKSFSMSNGLFEPEGIDVIKFLQEIGYKIGLDSQKLTFKQSHLEFKLIKHNIIPDRIETMTYVIMGLLTGEITVKKTNTKILAYPLQVLKNAGYNLVFTDYEIIAKKSYGEPINVKTGIYPGLPTDLQPLFGVLFLNTKGKSQIEETVFENRMHIYYDLIDSGVECHCLNNLAIVEGKRDIQSKNYKAYDLRQGAALLILAMLGNEASIISNFDYVLRGYDDIFSKIKKLGANIEVM